jgi:LCP family protein required for cell wall assembly
MDQNQEIFHGFPPLEQKITPPRRRWPKIILWSLIILVCFFAFFYIKHKIAPNDAPSWIDNIPIIGQVKHLAESADRELKGEERDRINILLLGVGGKNHDGGQLTDTIMVASYKPSTKQVSLFSIPRDLTIPIENMGWRKINNINAFAESREPGSGGLATSQSVGHLLDAPIDYYVRVDFDGFAKIIDEVGGVDVMVDNTLDDYSYPIRGREDNPDYYSRFEHLHVDKGWQHMDGELALKFARSRHGAGGEGSDFARARRQQKILEAVREKVLSSSTLLNPSKVSGIISELNNNISTNLKIWEIIKLFGLVKNINSADIINQVLDNSPSGLLVDGKGDNGAYILSPRSGDFSEITYLFNNLFGTPPSDKTQTKKPKEEIKLTVLNGTWINGLGSRKAVDLEQDGITIVEIGNSSRQNFEKSVIYDLGFGAKRSSLEFLKEKTGANIAPTLPDWLKEDLAATASTQTKQPDFILILGTDADKSNSGTENQN